MGCCGTKRNALKSETKYEAKETPKYASVVKEQHKVFEYLGNHSLQLKGVSSGKRYLFRYKGEHLKIDYMDSFAMMAEKDLKIISTE